MRSHPQEPKRPHWTRPLAVAASITLVTLLSACGGGSGAGDNAVLPGLVTAKSCNNIPGQLDLVQGAIAGQLRPAVQSIPTVGPVAATATTALSQTLDTVDALSNALTTLARTQNPQQFTAQLPGVGDSLLCAGASLSDALARLAVSQNIPGLTQAQQQLAAVSQQISNGLVGTAPGGDLRVLTNQLSALALQLKFVAGGLPAVANQPYLQQILVLNASVYDSLARVFNDLGALNGTQLAADVTGLLQATLDTFQLPANQLGLPTTALSPVTNQLRIASTALNGGLAAIASPTLQAVSAVLGGAGVSSTGTAAQSFSDLIDGAIANNGSVNSLARVTQLTQLLNGTPLLSLFTALLQTFGGRLPV